jgi:hypothetical protein
VTTLNPAAPAVAALHGMGLDRRHDLVAPVELTAGRVVGARDRSVRVGGVRSPSRLEHERVHARHPAQDEIEPARERKRSLQRLVSWSGWSSAISGRAASSVASRGLYFIVHVPKRLTPIIPSVSCERWR